MTNERQNRLVGGVYRVEDRIGAGAMGTVYAARHSVTGAEVALKLIHPHIAQAALNLARFEREVSIAARVGHDGIVKVFDAGLDPEDGSLFVAMERLHGHNLEQELRAPGTTQADLVRLMAAVCAPLAAAHAAGFVHRDLKPDNVFIHRAPASGASARLVRPQVKLLDFGIARDLGQKALTATNQGLGTPHYMAPEQATDARRVTQAADVWSIGVMLYWMVRGKLPFDGEGPFDTVLFAMTSPHEPIDPGAAPPALIDLIERSLAKTPEGRLPDAASVGRLLEAMLADPPLVRALAARPLPAPEPRRPADTLGAASMSGGTDGAIGDAARDLRRRARRAAQGEAPQPRSVEDAHRASSGPRATAPPPWPGSDERPFGLPAPPPSSSIGAASFPVSAVTAEGTLPASTPPPSPTSRPRAEPPRRPAVTVAAMMVFAVGAGVLYSWSVRRGAERDGAVSAEAIRPQGEGPRNDAPIVEIASPPPMSPGLEAEDLGSVESSRPDPEPRRRPRVTQAERRNDGASRSDESRDERGADTREPGAAGPASKAGGTDPEAEAGSPELADAASPPRTAARADDRAADRATDRAADPVAGGSRRPGAAAPGPAQAADPPADGSSPLADASEPRSGETPPQPRPGGEPKNQEPPAASAPESAPPKTESAAPKDKPSAPEPPRPADFVTF